jgi:hypothetical protein
MTPTLFLLTILKSIGQLVHLVIVYFYSRITDCVYKWCLVNFMKPTFSKIRVISFTRKTNRLRNSFVLRTECVNILVYIMTANFIFIIMSILFFWHALKLLGLIRTITFCFSTLVSLLMLCFTLVRSKLEYTSVAWNSLTITDSNKLQRIQRKFAALCHSRYGISL